MGVQVEQIRDLINTTQPHRPKMKISQLAQTIRKAVLAPMLLRGMKNSGVKGFAEEFNGTHYEFRANLSYGGPPQPIDMFGTATYSVPETTLVGTVPWRHWLKTVMYDIRESAMNKGPEKIADELLIRTQNAKLSLIELFENQAMTAPSDSTDTSHIFGLINYWIVTSAGATPGFNGGAPSGFAAGAGGIIHDNWRNWTFGYGSTFTEDPGLDLMAEAAEKTSFTQLIEMPSYQNRMPERIILMGWNTYKQWRKIARNANDDLKADLANIGGRLTYNGHPVICIPSLETGEFAATEPIVGLDTSVIFPGFLDGFAYKPLAAMIDPDQPTTVKQGVMTVSNLACVDRRRQFVGIKN